MLDLWEMTRKRLYAAADEVLSSGDDESLGRKKENFIKALQAFGEDIETMNREFTSRVLTLLRDYVERKINLTHDEGRSVVRLLGPTR
jgi:hypothetical protein